MRSFLDRSIRVLCAAQAGAQLCFAAIAAQVVFPHEVALLPHGDPRRTLAADLVGQMVARLDATTIAVASLAILLARALRLPARRSLPPLLAALCALVSKLVTTPAIQQLRAAGRTGEPAFGRLHALSSGLLLLEIALFAWAALRPDTQAPPEENGG